MLKPEPKKSVSKITIYEIDGKEYVRDLCMFDRIIILTPYKWQGEDVVIKFKREFDLC